MVAILTPAVLVWSTVQAARLRQWRYLRERCGGGAESEKSPLWIHAASVGEVNALRPLIAHLSERLPELPVLVTTLTPTGAQAVERLPGRVRHRYLPWDAPVLVRRFLDHAKPRCAVIVETELWPNLYRECARRGIPPMIINGRLSGKSLHGGEWLKRAYASALQNCAAILTRSSQDTENFLRLGADPEKVQLTGNIKYGPNRGIDPLIAQPALPRPYLLAASTHDDEELRIARAWLRHPAQEHMLVLAPRHPERAKELIPRLSRLTPHLAVRSRNDEIDRHTTIYLADTLGELPWLMHHASAVFVGGSLIKRGGHNLIEPAQLGKAILTGPSTENFADERFLLEQADALLVVDDELELVVRFRQLLADEPMRRRLETNARAAVEPFADIAESYAGKVLAHCRQSSR